jgi:hypothetical protein
MKEGGVEWTVEPHLGTGRNSSRQQSLCREKEHTALCIKIGMIRARKFAKGKEFILEVFSFNKEMCAYNTIQLKFRFLR